MKVNAPKKIYLHPDLDSIFGITDRSCESDVEYTRTDAFIEKACDWLAKHAKKYYFNKERYLGTEELVEDFKLSMEM